MSDQIFGQDGIVLPMRVDGGAEALELLRRIAEGIETTGEKSEEASQKTASGFERAQSAIHDAADTFNEVRDAVSSLVGDIGAMVESLAAGADEAAALSERSRDLGLDFDQAAEAAGRFVDETVALNSANQLSARGLQLSQREMDALMRVAGATSQALRITSQEGVERLTEALITGRGRALAPFGEELTAMAGNTHTAGERLAALVRQADATAPAVDTARDAVDRFKDSLEDLQRDFSSGFVDGIRNMERVASEARGANDEVEGLNGSVRDLGAFMGETLSRAANGFRAVLAFLGLGVQSILTSVGALGAALESVASGNIRGAGTAAANYFRDSATNGRMGELFAELQRSVAAVNAQADAPPGTGAGARTAPPAGRDARSTRGAVGSSGGGGGGAQRPRGADMTFSLDEAQNGDSMTRERARVDALLEEERRAQQAIQDEKARGEARARDQRATAEEERVKAREREQEDARKRLEALHSFNGQWRELHSEQVNVAASAAQSLNVAFGSIGDALAKHFDALVSGQETLAAALQGILGDVLDSMAKEAFAKGGFYFAEGLARLVMYDVPGAVTSFGASAAYFAAGAGARALGSAVSSPAAPAAAAGGGAASAPRGAESFGRPANDAGAGGGQTVVNHYYAPVIGGRDALDSEVGQRMGRYSDAASSRQVRDRRAA